MHPDGSKIYVVNGEDDNVVVLDANTNNLIGFIPVGRSPRAIGQFIKPASGGTPPPPKVTVFQDNIENGINGWFSVGSWAQTNASSYSPTHSWTDSPNGNYQNGLNIALYSPVINLTGANSARLTFWHRFDLGSEDTGAVWVKPVNKDPVFLRSFTGTNPTWHQEIVSLDAFHGQSGQIVFQLSSDSSITADGWYIDDVAVDVPGGGDWTGEGRAKVGVFRQGAWYLDLNGNGTWDGCGPDGCGSFGGAGDRPVRGAW
jgi:YVTN family beta-propeller protein